MSGRLAIRTRDITAALMALCVPEGVEACRGWNPPPLPMETAASWEARADVAIRNHGVALNYERELRNLAEAKRIYLAKITSTSRQEFQHTISVRPVKAVRGSLPNESVALRATFKDCDIEGSEAVVFSKTGDFLFVFEGVSTNGANGSDSMMAADVHSKLLSDELSRYISVTDGGPYRFDENGLMFGRQSDGSFKPMPEQMPMDEQP